MGELCPKSESYTPLIKQKLISTPPSHNDNIKATPPPRPLEKSLLPLIPLYLVYYSKIPVWLSFFFFEAQFNHTVFYLPYFKFVLLLKSQQLGFSFC